MPGFGTFTAAHWRENKIVEIERDPEQFWQAAIDLLRQQFKTYQLFETVDFGHCDYNNWLNSVMGHGSASIGQSDPTRRFRGRSRLISQVTCGSVKSYDGKSASVSWTMEIGQGEISQGRGSVAIRQISCTLTATVVPSFKGRSSDLPWVKYRFQTKCRELPTRPIFINKELLSANMTG